MSGRKHRLLLALCSLFLLAGSAESADEQLVVASQEPGVSPLEKLKNHKLDEDNIYDYAEFAAALIARTITVDQAMADEMFAQATNALRDFAQRFPSERSELNYYLSDMVDEIIDANDSLPTAKFLLARIQAKDALFAIDISYELEDVLTDNYDERYDQLEEQFEKTVVEERLELEIAKKLLQEYAEIFGTLHVPGVLDFMDSFYLESEHLNELLSWIKGQANPDCLLMNEVEVWAELELRSLDSEPESLPESFVAFYKKLISNENISSHYRLSIYENVSYEYAQYPQWDALTFQAAELLSSIDGTIDDGYDPEEVLEQITLSMLQLEVTEHWRELATKTCAVWRKTVFPAEQDPVSHSSGDTPRGASQLALMMLDMHLKLDDLANSQRILNRRDLGLNRDITTYAILLQYPEQKNWTIEHFQKNWSQLSFASLEREHSFSYALTGQMRTVADEIIAAVDPGEVQYLLDVIYASFPAGDSALLRVRPKKTARQPRIDELIDYFAQIEFQNETLRRRCLALLPYDPKLKGVFAELYDQQEPLALALDDKAGADGNRQRYMKYLKDKLADGKLDEFKAKLTALEPGLQLEGSWQVRQMIRQIYEVAGSHLFAKSKDRPVKWGNTPAELLAFGIELSGHGERLSDRTNESPSANSSLHKAILILHYICNRPEQARILFPVSKSLKYEEFLDSNPGSEISPLVASASRDGYLLLQKHAVHRKDCVRMFTAALKTEKPNVENMAKGLIALYGSVEGAYYFAGLGSSPSDLLPKLPRMENNANYDRFVSLLKKMEESKE